MLFLSAQYMHIPDGFLSVAVAVALWLLSIVAIAFALRRVNKDLDERKIPLMGVLAAAIFAGQMLNFAVTGGTSGHLMGAAIATILLGPWAATLILTAVVGIQALIFQDGGILALGANIFNMAVIGVWVAFFTFRTVMRLSRGQKWGVFGGGFAAGWLSIFIAALAVALQLALSGTSPANLAVPTMAGIHALIGIGEGLITVGALAFMYAARRDLVVQGSAGVGGGKAVWVGGLLAALALAILAPLASTHPDGLEWVAGQKGFLGQARASSFNVIPNYLIPGVSNQAVATILAGVLGLLLVLVVVLALAYSRRHRSTAESRQP
jgi:cobalt/nickel transport system permease protein